MDLGDWRTVRPCNALFLSLTSTRSVFRDCWTLLQLNRTEPPYADPHVRWCGRGEWATTPPMPIARLPARVLMPYNAAALDRAPGKFTTHLKEVGMRFTRISIAVLFVVVAGLAAAQEKAPA